MGWGSAIAQTLGAAGAGEARGKFNRQQMDDQDLKDALVEEARKRQEARANRQLDIEDKRLTGAEADRKESRSARLAARADAQARADADRAERGRESDQRATTARTTAATRAAKTPNALNPDIRRQQFVDHRRAELMKPTKGRFNKVTPGMEAGAAQQQAAREADEIFTPGAPAPKPTRTADPGGDIDLRTPSDPVAHLKASAARAIANGADAAKVNARLAEKLKELGAQ